MDYVDGEWIFSHYNPDQNDVTLVPFVIDTKQDSCWFIGTIDSVSEQDNAGIEQVFITVDSVLWGSITTNQLVVSNDASTSLCSRSASDYTGLQIVGHCTMYRLRLSSIGTYFSTCGIGISGYLYHAGYIYHIRHYCETNGPLPSDFNAAFEITVSSIEDLQTVSTRNDIPHNQLNANSHINSKSFYTIRGRKRSNLPLNQVGVTIQTAPGLKPRLYRGTGQQ
jgi:hypothetical protein